MNRFWYILQVLVLRSFHFAGIKSSLLDKARCASPFDLIQKNKGILQFAHDVHTPSSRIGRTPKWPSQSRYIVNHSVAKSGAYRGHYLPRRYLDFVAMEMEQSAKLIGMAEDMHKMPPTEVKKLY